MWIVTQDYIKGQLVYLVEHTITGERRGMFDWQARAQEFADQLNREETDGRLNQQTENEGHDY